MPDENEPPGTEAWMALHDAAVSAGEDGYLDPDTGLFVFTAAYHLARGACCDTNCRHCPFRTSS